MIIELPEIACVLVHGCARETAQAFAARHFSEELLLDLALVVERERPWPLTTVLAGVAP